MREIKFRAWHHGGGDPRVTGRMEFSGHFPHLFWKNVEEWPLSVEVMQYTGLKDKNGNPIYEGDVVETADSMATISASSVSWNNENATFWLDAWDEWLGDTTDDLEVIGNIYENPDLINQTNGT